MVCTILNKYSLATDKEKPMRLRYWKLYKCNFPLEIRRQMSHNIVCRKYSTLSLSLRYHGLQTDVSKPVDVFGNVSGRSWTASLGRIKAGIPLLKTNGGIEGDRLGGKGRSFLSWLWRGDDGGEGNLVARHVLLSARLAAFAPTAGEMAGKPGSSAWLCCWWRVSNNSLGGWWGSFCFWHEDAKCDRSCVRTGTVMLSAVIRNCDTLAAHSLNPARYFASSVK